MNITTDNANYTGYQIQFTATDNELLINFSNRFFLELQKSEQKRNKFKNSSRRLFESLEMDINNPNVSVETVVKQCFQNLLQTPESRIFSTLLQAITKNTPYTPELFYGGVPELKEFDYELPNLYFEKSLVETTEGVTISIKVIRVGNVSQLQPITQVNYDSYNYNTTSMTESDFNPSGLPSGVLSFASYETEKTINIGIAGTNPLEATESFQIVLSNQINANLFRRICIVRVINTA